MNTLSLIIIYLIQFLLPGTKDSKDDLGNIEIEKYGREEGLSFDEYGNPVW